MGREGEGEDVCSPDHVAPCLRQPTLSARDLSTSLGPVLRHQEPFRRQSFP
jgi:hypothetical protein